MKRKSFIISICIVTTIVVLLLIIQPWEKKPFKNLSANEITSVSVRLLPPSKTFNLSSNEIIELTELLNSVVVYNKDSSHNQYNGQAVIYTITKIDGTILTINAFNPFLIVGGVGYKTKYEPCEELNALGNRIMSVRLGVVDEPVLIDSISLILQSFSPNGATFIINNKTDKPYTYGEDYSLQIFKNDIWEAVPYVIDKWGFNSIGYEVPNQSNTDKIAIDWNWLYGELPDGQYRLSKTTRNENESIEIYDEFELVNGTEYEVQH